MTDLNEENWSLQDEAELGELEFTGMRGIGVYRTKFTRHNLPIR